MIFNTQGKTKGGNNVSRERHSGGDSFFHIFWGFFLLDFRRFFTKRNIFIISAVFLILIISVHHDIESYKNLPIKIQNSKKIQKEYFKAIRNYDDYSSLGVYLYFFPSPTGVLFQNTTLSPDNTAKVDSIVKVEILENLKGKTASRGIELGRQDFSSLVLWFVTILALLYGYEAMETRDFLLSFTGFLHRVKFFSAIIVSRFLIISSAFLTIFIGVLFFLRVRGLEFSSGDYTGLKGYAIVTLLMILFFIILGSILGTLSSIKFSIIAILGVVIFFNVILPRFTQTIVEKKFPDIVQSYKAEMEKFRIVSDFESSSEEESGVFNRKQIESEKKLVEKYKSISLKEIEDKENRLIKDFKDAVSKTQKLAVLNPSTFYLLTCNEVSSKGYKNFLEYYEFVTTMWIKFSMFWIDRVFYHDHKIIVNFIKKDEDIFRSRSLLPGYYYSGLLVILVEIILLFALAYYRFNRWLYPKPSNPEAFKHADMKFAKGKHYTLIVERPDFSRQFMNKICGQGGTLPWHIELQRTDLHGKTNLPFFYIPNYKKIPGDIKIRDLLRLFKILLKPALADWEDAYGSLDKQLLKKRYKNLKMLDKVAVLLSLARLVPVKIYVLMDFVQGITDSDKSKLPDYMGILKYRESTVIDIVSVHNYWQVPDECFTVGYRDGFYLLYKGLPPHTPPQ